jgi:mannose-6-phosphate isomerase-like protein (cupin superfamily)
VSDEIQVIDLDQGPSLPIVEGDGSAHAVIWPGMGAQLRSIHRIELMGGARTVQLRHSSEAVYYVVRGGGEAVDADADEVHALVPGAMIHIDPGTQYVLRAGADGISLVGGPSPPDPDLYAEAS